jgi:hypothetical protein
MARRRNHSRPGARFRGRNRNGIWRWGRLCQIVVVQPGELAWRTVPTRRYPDSSEWRITLHPSGTGTGIEQTFRVLKAPKLLEPIYATIIPSHRDRTKALTTDLERLGALAARPAANADTEPPPPGQPVTSDALRAAARQSARRNSSTHALEPTAVSAQPRPDDDRARGGL